jgi:Ca-activated chloride channel family protein
MPLCRAQFSTTYSRRFKDLILAGVVLAASAASAFAGQPLRHDGNAEAASFSSQSRLVLIPVTVTDHRGKIISDLKREHFRVVDDSKPREIVSLTRVYAPVSLGIVFDLSSSMRTKLSYATEAASAIIRTLDEEDAGYLVTFDKSPKLRVEFTRNVAALGEALVFQQAKGNTALYDGINLGLRHSKEGKGFRKVLLVISDGGDNRSRMMESEIVAAALEADVQIYCLSVHNPLRPKDEVAGSFFMDRLARLTGGLRFDIRGRGEIPGMAQTMALAMKDQYLLGFKPAMEDSTGKWRKLRVSVDLPGARLRVTAKNAYLDD